MKRSTPVNTPQVPACLWLAGTLCLPFGILHAENPNPAPAPTPIPITIVDARLESRELPAKPGSFREMAALPGFAVLVNDRSLSILRAGKDTPEPAAVLLQIPESIDNNICMDMGSITIGPVLGPKHTLFVGMDEGGLSGGWLSWARGAESGDVDLNPGRVPSDLLALDNRLFVATDHGVAEITDPAGKPVVRHFVDRADGKPLGPTFGLIAHGKTLLAVAGYRILQLDPDRHSATLYRLTVKQPLMSICRFDGHFYGVGSGPLVRFDLPYNL
jgi:hypothetical protein